MSKIIINYNDKDDFPAPDANQTFVAANNILMDIANKNGVAIEESNNNALINGLNSIAMNRYSAFDVSGTANEIILTTNTNYSTLPIIKYTPFLRGGFFATLTNTDTITIKIDSLGALNAVKPNGTILGAGEVIAGSYIQFIYSVLDDKMIIIGGLKDTSSAIIKTHSITFTRTDTYTLLASAGIISDEYLTSYITFSSPVTLNFNAAGVINSRAASTTFTANTWYWIFACTKTNGTAGYLIDSNELGANATITFGNLGYDITKMTRAGCWKVNAAGTAIETTLRNPSPKIYTPLDVTRFTSSQYYATLVGIPTAATGGNLYPSGCKLATTLTFMVTLGTTSSGNWKIYETYKQNTIVNFFNASSSLSVGASIQLSFLPDADGSITVTRSSGQSLAISLDSFTIL